MLFPVQKIWNIFVVALFFLFFLPFSLVAEEVFCHICHSRIQGRYFLINKLPCCSSGCVAEMRRQILPECALCRKSMEKYVTISSPAGGEKSFCIPCSRYAKCFHCKFPRKGMRRLPDSRRLCQECSRYGIVNSLEADRLFMRTRREFGKLLGLATSHRISFALADVRKMMELNPEGGRKEWGLFHAQTRTETRITRSARTGKVIKQEPLRTEKKYAVWILSHLTPESFATVAVHELTHDYMSEY